jgi:hypothetical protein
MRCDTLTEGTKDGRFSKVTNYTLVPLWQSANSSWGIPSFVILPYELAKISLLSWQYSYRCTTPHRNPAFHSRVINSSATYLSRTEKNEEKSCQYSRLHGSNWQRSECEMWVRLLLFCFHNCTYKYALQTSHPTQSSLKSPNMQCTGLDMHSVKSL